MPYCKCDLTVRELAPLLDNGGKTCPWRLVDDFAGFAASSLERQSKGLWLLARHPVCQITGTNEHVELQLWSTPTLLTIGSD